MLTKFILFPAILLTHVSGGEFSSIYDIPGPHWFNHLKSCQSVADAGNQNLNSGKGQRLRIVSIQSYFNCKPVHLEKEDEGTVPSEKDQN